MPYLKRARFWNHIYVLFFVMVSFIIFDASSLQEALRNITGLFGIGTKSLISTESIYYLNNYIFTFVIAIIGATPLPRKLYERVMNSSLGKKVVFVAEPVIMVLFLIIITAFLVDGSFNPFLYFRF